MTSCAEPRRRVIRPFALAVLGALLLSGFSACQQTQATWYEERCQRIGLKPGTASFNDCIERDQQWVEGNRRRALRSSGP